MVLASSIFDEATNAGALSLYQDSHGDGVASYIYIKFDATETTMTR